MANLSAKQNLYFDYNATAPLCERAKNAVIHALDITGNPSSIHNHGRAARNAFEKARQNFSTLIKPGRFDSLIFNSGGTEGNNTVLKTFQTPEMASQDALIVHSTIEHPCILNSISSQTAAKSIPTTADGLVDLSDLETVLKDYRQARPKAPILVSIMFVNNETGVIQPLADIIRIAKAYGAFVHSDIVQAIGRIPFDVETYPLDYATVSSHKIGGLTGFGALYVRAKCPYEAMVHGGGQEQGKRSGTSNLSGATAFANALEDIIEDRMLAKWNHVVDLRDHLERSISEHCPGTKIWGAKSPRVANTTSLMMPGVDGMTQIMSFDLEGISISAGSACSSGKISPSHVLKAMGIADEQALNTIRVSLPSTTTQDDISRFVKAWIKIYNRCHQSQETDAHKRG